MPSGRFFLTVGDPQPIRYESMNLFFLIRLFPFQSRCGGDEQWVQFEE